MPSYVTTVTPSGNDAAAVAITAALTEPTRTLPLIMRMLDTPPD